MSKNTGGPAFPALERLDSPSHEYRAYSEGGMTLRDYFAAKALPGIVTAVMADECHNWKPADFAHEAYQIADAMLAERAK